MKKNIFKKLVPALILAGLTIGQTASASYTLSFSGANYLGSGNHASSSGTEALLCHFTYGGGYGGSLSSSYRCSTSLDQILYNGSECDYADDAYIVAKDKWGRSYTWNVCDWNGMDEISCNFGRYFNCKEIYVYGSCQTPCRPVPEPSTVAAAALLLVPLGIQAARRLRRQRKQP